MGLLYPRMMSPEVVTQLALEMKPAAVLSLACCSDGLALHGTCRDLFEKTDRAGHDSN